jgi:hypothetical protein
VFGIVLGLLEDALNDRSAEHTDHGPSRAKRELAADADLVRGLARVRGHRGPS